MRRSIWACGLLLAFAGMSTAVSAASSDTGQSPAAKLGPTGASAARAEALSIAYWSGKARRERSAVRQWVTVVRGQPPQQIAPLRPSNSPHAAWRQARAWHRRQVAASQLAHNPPQLRTWYCIHSYEGSWSDPNAPYWGGLQMDYSFQSAYGSWLLRHHGTADHWTPLEQIWTAVRAWRVRGFSPWPNTARNCGVYYPD